MKYRHVIVFVIVVFIASVITGFIYGINNFYDLTDYITTLEKSYYKERIDFNIS